MSLKVTNLKTYIYKKPSTIPHIHKPSSQQTNLMSSLETKPDQREGAEIFNGGSTCKQKANEILSTMNLPKGLLPLDNMTEIGHNKTTGYIWIKINKNVQHRFKAIGRNVSYDSEVTAFVENRRMRGLTGIKSKELLLWVTISEIFVNDEDQTKITFANPTGLSRTFPVTAFEEEEK
ncbi:unnamed protein product [Brassica oleracea var. botrytis]|uniref:DUF538 family protein n=2 Tax=Brassica oleracea TaxID=3712 RepID=A0A0D3E6T3_BRAOL|nr:PREDICTED: uncharacterized protein LOC106313366 [Brassica oleracea var. oleracea]VDD30386.1 unnamed protein product [Brassica oleracea]